VLTIGALARLAGITPDAIRYYERRGLLPRPPRTPSGYRQFPDGAAHRLAVIRNAQRFGFSLAQIAAFLRVRDAARDAADAQGMGSGTRHDAAGPAGAVARARSARVTSAPESPAAVEAAVRA